ncbi:adhesion G-protein coupled receptor G6 isoform X2 [Pseudorasbora parva]
MHTFKKYLPVTIYLWIVGSSLICSGSSLWGKKISFANRCVWQLNKNVIIPPLEELSVCVNIMKIITSEWTVFDYKSPGQQHVELGLVGNRGNLKASLFGKEWIAPYDLPNKKWHTVCLTWSSHTRLFQMIVNKAIFNFHLNETSPRFLAANGTLTLGVSHSFVGGAIDFETGKEFLGDMSLFRMWGVQLSPLELDACKCVDGNIITWRTQDWDYRKCPTIQDDSLKCESSKYKIQMNTSITQNTNNGNTENEIKEIVLHWLEDIFSQEISVHSVFLSNLSPQTGAGLTEQNKGKYQGSEKPSIKTQWFDCVVFVRVIPGSVSETVSKIQRLLIPIYNYSENIFLITNPDSINILSVALLPNVSLNPAVTTAAPATKSPDRESTNITTPVTHTSLQTLAMENICSGFTSYRDFGDVFCRVNLNLTMTGSVTDPTHTILKWLQETLGKCKMNVLNLVVKRAPKYITTFQVQSLAAGNFTAIERLILELLTKGYTNASISINVPTGEVKVIHIDPGLCPDEFMLTVYGIYMWPAMTAQSQYEMGCEQGDESATRFCKLNGATDRAVWDPPDMSKCIRTVDVDDLENITVTADNSADIVDMIEDLLREETSLSDAQLDIVLKKLSAVTEVGTLTTDLSSSITNIVSDICLITTNPTQVTNKVLSITDLMGDRTVFTGDAHNMTAPSLALQLINPDTSQFHGLTFEVSSLHNDSTPEIFYDENFTEHPDAGTVAFISLPPAIESFFPNNQARPRVQFQFYAKENFFQDPAINMTLNSYVVSASVTNATVSNLEMPVMVTLRHLQNKEDWYTVKCVFWDFKKNNEKGGWNDTGCKTMKSNASYTSCSCDHLTHFGVLLDISKTPISIKDERILTVISYIGSGISSIFLGVTLLTYLVFEKLRRDYPSKILINLSVALLGFNMLFLVNSWFASFNSNALCITVAAFLHYFFLATFTWMGLGAVNMYLALVKVFNSYVQSYIHKFCAVGWGLPLLVVSLVLAIDKNSYGAGLSRALFTEESTAFCWLNNDVTFYVTVVSFVILIMVCNVCVFAVVLVQIRKMRVNKPASSRKGILHDLRVVASLTFLLGLTWTLAFVAWGPAKTPLLYLFSFLNSLQGFFIFLFYCLMKDNVRKQWRIHLCCGKFGQTESDWSHSVTPNAKAKDGKPVFSTSMNSETTSERKISDTSNSGASHDGVFLTQDRKQSKKIGGRLFKKKC